MRFKISLFSFNFLSFLISTWILLFSFAFILSIFISNILIITVLMIFCILVSIYLLYPAVIVISDERLTIIKPFRKEVVINLDKVVIIGSFSGDFSEIPYYTSIYYHTSFDLTQDKGNKYSLGFWSKKDVYKVLDYIKQNYSNIKEINLPKL